LPDKYENYKQTVQKAFTVRKVVFGVNESIIELKDLSAAELQKKAGELATAGSVSFVSDLPLAGTKYTTVTDFATNATVSSFSNYASTASYVATASYVSNTFSSINIVGGGATGSFATNIIYGVNPDSGSVAIDSIPIESGNAARWLVSVNDGDLNFKTTEVVASWNNYAAKFNNTEVNQIGSVPVHMSVSNAISGSISLVATPLAGTWTLKMIRMMV
jgi:hypothetical protein